MDSRAQLLRGGDLGEPAVRPGKSQESFLIRVVAGLEEDLKMPPKGPPLSDQQIGKLRAWIDQGATWPNYVTVAHDPDNTLAYWDQRLALHPQTGQLVAMFWTHDFVAGTDRDIHIAWGSADGRDWIDPQGTGLPGQHCQPLALGGALLLAAYTHRRDPPGIRLSLSDDFGRTWDRSRDLMVYDSSAGTESGAGLSLSLIHI